MNRIFGRAFAVGLLGIAGLSSPLLADSFYITGLVSGVGSNLGTAIDGSSATYEQFIDRDPFEIRLTFDRAQTPHTVTGPGGVGVTASYRLLETSITIFGDEQTFNWTYSTPLADNNSHDFSITNNVSGYDRFNTGLTGGAFVGPTLGPGSRAFSHWTSLWADYEATTFSDNSIPYSFDFPAFNYKEMKLIFVGYTDAETITLAASGISVIPEASSLAWWGGLAALGAVVSLRRRRA